MGHARRFRRQVKAGSRAINTPGLLAGLACLVLQATACHGVDPLLADDDCLNPLFTSQRMSSMFAGDTMSIVAVREPCGINVVAPPYSWEVAGEAILKLTQWNDSTVLVEAVHEGSTGVSLMGSFSGRMPQVLFTIQLTVLPPPGAG